MKYIIKREDINCYVCGKMAFGNADFRVGEWGRKSAMEFDSKAEAQRYHRNHIGDKRFKIVEKTF